MRPVHRTHELEMRDHQVTVATITPENHTLIAPTMLRAKMAKATVYLVNLDVKLRAATEKQNAFCKTLVVPKYYSISRVQ